MRPLSGMIATAFVLAATPALADTPVPIDWSTITGYSTTGTVTTAVGTLDAGGATVGVTYSGQAAFVQTGSSGGYYWDQGNPAPFTGGQYNAGSGYVAGKTLADAPGDNSLFALADPTHMTITFTQPVANVYMALVSWNGDGIANFTSPFTPVSSGVGHYGEGSFGNLTSTGFTGNGELHGVIEFSGSITTLDFDVLGTDNWHGLLIGTEGLAPPPPPPTSGVPEPSSWALMIGGFGLVGGALRRTGRIAPATA